MKLNFITTNQSDQNWMSITENRTLTICFTILHYKQFSLAFIFAIFHASLLIAKVLLQNTRLLSLIKAFLLIANDYKLYTRVKQLSAQSIIKADKFLGAFLGILKLHKMRFTVVFWFLVLYYSPRVCLGSFDEHDFVPTVSSFLISKLIERATSNYAHLLTPRIQVSTFNFGFLYLTDT